MQDHGTEIDRCRLGPAQGEERFHQPARSWARCPQDSCLNLFSNHSNSRIKLTSSDLPSLAIPLLHKQIRTSFKLSNELTTYYNFNTRCTEMHYELMHYLRRLSYLVNLLLSLEIDQIVLVIVGTVLKCLALSPQHWPGL